MTSMILDGSTRFGCSLIDFYRQPMLTIQAARFGILIPPTADVDEDAIPALAYVDALADGMARWIANCPDCGSRSQTAAEYVWLATPLMFCMKCCNIALSGRWRRVVVPPNRVEIERLLLARPDPRTRSWKPEQSIDELLEVNVMLAGGGG